MEIEFKRDTAFRKQFFVPDSFAHPAKMDAQLLIWIVERYTKPGEVILDPMAGMGTTMLACGLGRNVVLVELEGKFCKMCRDNWEQVKMSPQLGFTMGSCQIIQGDARNLEGLLADKIITSPPYTNRMDGGMKDAPGMLYTDEPKDSWYTTRNQNNIGNLPYGNIDKIITSPPFGEAHDTKDLGVGDNDRADLRAYSYLKTETEGQIGNLPYGNVDKIITSPPYAEAQSGGGIAVNGYQGDKHSPTDLVGKRSYMPDVHGKTEGQIANLPYGSIDKIVTSPPYEESMGEKHHSPRADKLAEEKSNPVTYTDRVDKIVTSPPYEGSSTTRQDRESATGKLARDWQGKGGSAFLDKPVGESEGQIGNLKSTSYLEAMLQVYSQCHKILKSEGLMILVLKNFIRNKQVIRLDLDTIKLCEQVGFKLAERHYRKLSSQSFWRIIYYQKHPEVEVIDREDILVFQKPDDFRAP